MIFRRTRKENQDKVIEKTELNQPKSIENKKDRLRKTLNHNQEIIIDKINKRVEEAGSATENLIGTINYISKNVENQIKAITKVVDQIQSYSALAEQVSASTTDSQEIAEKTMEVAKEGNIAVDNSIRAMNDIEKSVDFVKEVVNSLSKQATQVDNMLQIIKNISSQTNLLALNAAIEAARAGEHGRGFAVVADEVRKLANQSDEAAEQISATIKDINQSISKTIDAMDTSSNKVKEGVSIANNTNLVFNEIIKSIETTTTVTREISAAIGEQVTTLQDVTLSTEDLGRSSESIMAMIGTMLMNTEHTQSSIAALQQTSKNLLHINNKILEIINNNDKDKDERTYTLRTTMEGEATSLDPAVIFDSETFRLLENVHAPLLIKGLGNDILPGVAKSWSIQEDNLTWIFNLRRGAKFHNGREIKASDVKYSLERLLSPTLKSPNSWFLAEVDGSKEFEEGKAREVRGIRVLDNYRIEIRLAKPYSGFLLNLAQTCCSIVAKEDVEKGQITGCGPYILEGRDSEKYILKAYKDYFAGSPYVDTIEVVYEGKTHIENYLDGKIDFMILNSNRVKELSEKNQRVKINTTNVLITNFFGFNLKRNSIFSRDKDIRKAINYAVNKQRIIKDIMVDLATEAKGVFPPAIIDNSYLSGFSYNPTKAKEILRSKGLRPTDKLSILAREENVGAIIEYIVEDLKAVGIECDIVKVPGKKYMSPESIAKADLYSMGWVADTGDPDNYLQPLFNPEVYTNFGGYNNPQVTELMDKAKEIISPEKRLSSYKRIEEMIIEDAPWLFLYHPKMAYVYKDGLSNVNLSTLGKIKYDDIMILDNI